ncbi:uncharacterized protein ASCRUDRAFT_19445, partial [Ascoidea rubescens DSM 1968]
SKKTKKVIRKIPPKPKNYDKLIWLTGHCLSLSFGLIYFLSRLSNIILRTKFYYLVRFSYRLSIFGSLLALSLTVSRKFGRKLPTNFALLSTENFQYLLLALIWFLSRSSIFKIFPYLIISFLQLTREFNYLEKIPQNYLLNLTLAISYNELLLIFVLFIDTLLMRGVSGFAFVAFITFYWLRILFSNETKSFVLNFFQVVEKNVVVKLPKQYQGYFYEFLELVKKREVRD